MKSNIFIIICFGIFASLDAKKAIMVPQHPYILNLKLEFNEDTITDFVVESLSAKYANYFDESTHCDLNPYDIYKIIPIKKITTNNIDSLLQTLNISWYEDDLSEFIANLNYTELKNMGFSATKVYGNLVDVYFETNPAGILDTLNILGIAGDFSTAYLFGTDEDIFTAFQKGNFSTENLKAIANIVNAPTYTFKQIASIWGIKHLEGPYIENFFNNVVPTFFLERGLKSENLKEFLISLNFTMSHYKHMPSFKTCYDNWTKNQNLAVAISPNEIITNDGTVIENHLNLQNYTTLTAKSFQNPLMEFIVPLQYANQIENNLITITIDDILPSYIPMTDTYQELTLKNCTYVTIGINGLVSHNTTVQMILEKVTIMKVLGTTFKLSSPLVCEGKLFGLASKESVNSISFDVFNVNDTTDTPFEDEELFATFQDLFVNFLTNIDPCELMDCVENDVTLPN